MCVLVFVCLCNLLAVCCACACICAHVSKCPCVHKFVSMIVHVCVRARICSCIYMRPAVGEIAGMACAIKVHLCFLCVLLRLCIHVTQISVVVYWLSVNYVAYHP